MLHPEAGIQVQRYLYHSTRLASLEEIDSRLGDPIKKEIARVEAELDQLSSDSAISSWAVGWIALNRAEMDAYLIELGGRVVGELDKDVRLKAASDVLRRNKTVVQVHDGTYEAVFGHLPRRTRKPRKPLKSRALKVLPQVDLRPIRSEKPKREKDPKPRVNLGDRLLAELRRQQAEPAHTGACDVGQLARSLGTTPHYLRSRYRVLVSSHPDLPELVSAPKEPSTRHKFYELIAEEVEVNPYQVFDPYYYAKRLGVKVAQVRHYYLEASRAAEATSLPPKLGDRNAIYKIVGKLMKLGVTDEGIMQRMNIAPGTLNEAKRIIRESGGYTGDLEEDEEQEQKRALEFWERFGFKRYEIAKVLPGLGIRLRPQDREREWRLFCFGKVTKQIMKEQPYRVFEPKVVAAELGWTADQVRSAYREFARLGCELPCHPFDHDRRRQIIGELIAQGRRFEEIAELMGQSEITLRRIYNAGKEVEQE